MTVKVFVSGICGSHDVRKTQQRVLFILSTLPVDLEIIDVTEPGREQERALMQEEVRKHNKKDILPPQIFNGDQYCGNYEDFQLAADDDVLMSFLKLEEAPSKSEMISTKANDAPIIQNGLKNEKDITEVKENAEISESLKSGEENIIEPITKIESVSEVANIEADVTEEESPSNVGDLQTEDASMIEETQPKVVEQVKQEESEEESSEEESEEEEESD